MGYCRISQHKTTVQQSIDIVGGIIYSPSINITTKEEIISVSYSIDGNSDYLSIFTEPPYDWKIQKPIGSLFGLRGKHKLGVHVYTDTGKTAYDEMDFYALIRI